MDPTLKAEIWVMIIEDIGKDEVVVFDETRKFLRKRIRILLNFHNGRAFYQFNEEEKMYEIFLPRNTPKDPEKLLRDYNVNHEVHHIWKPICLPTFLGVRPGFPFKTNFEIDLDALWHNMVINFRSGLNYLNEEIRKALEEKIERAVSFFIRYVNSLELPQPLAFLNAFEDYAIEFHLKIEHKNLREYKSYTMEALRNFIEYVRSIQTIIRDFVGIPILIQIPLTSTKGELENIYQYFDFKAMLTHKVHPEDYYKSYLSYGKKVLDKTHKKNFAERYRIELESKRVEKARKSIKKFI